TKVVKRFRGYTASEDEVFRGFTPSELLRPSKASLLQNL
ncbi:hypothetical protein A2U01_0109757, partial [Trifolium medium]|nr:hypothetical protein [Trifolium medium]